MILPRCFGVFGHPIGHSRSPSMHGAAFEALGLPHRYSAFEVTPQRLGEALRGAAAMGFGGVNLTVPLKQAALQYLDELAPQAEEIGAVNTVQFTPEGMVGHNTDGAGFLVGLRRVLPALPQTAMVLGGGGASRAVVHTLSQAGIRVSWVSRTPERLTAWPHVQPTAYASVNAELRGVSLLVNGTTVGMKGGALAFPVPLALEALPVHAAVVDLVYPRPSGGLLDRAEALGLKTQSGLPMLWGQGVLALETWLGCTIAAPVRDAMARAIELEVDA